MNWVKNIEPLIAIIKSRKKKKLGYSLHFQIFLNKHPYKTFLLRIYMGTGTQSWDRIKIRFSGPYSQQQIWIWERCSICPFDQWGLREEGYENEDNS